MGARKTLFDSPLCLNLVAEFVDVDLALSIVEVETDIVSGCFLDHNDHENSLLHLYLCHYLWIGTGASAGVEAVFLGCWYSRGWGFDWCPPRFLCDVRADLVFRFLDQEDLEKPKAHPLPLVYWPATTAQRSAVAAVQYQNSHGLPMVFP
jgi:hypothetical protein